MSCTSVYASRLAPYSILPQGNAGPAARIAKDAACRIARGIYRQARLNPASLPCEAAKLASVIGPQG